MSKDDMSHYGSEALFGSDEAGTASKLYRCGLLESLAATYRKFGHMGKLACGAIRVTKMAKLRR